MFTFQVMGVFRLKWILILSCMTILNSVLCQVQYLNKTIYLETGVFNLSTILTSVTQQTGIVFSYNTKKMDIQRKLRVQSNIKTVDQFFDFLKKETGVTIKIIENYAVLTPNEPLQKYSAVQQQNPGLSSVIKIESSKQSDPKNKTEVGVDSAKAFPAELKADVKSASELEIEPIVDSLVSENNPTDSVVLVDSLSIRTQASSIAINNETLPDTDLHSDSIIEIPSKSEPYTVLKPIAKSISKRKDIFLNSGITFDESSYMGLTIQSGLPIAYASISVNSNRLATHFRYGIGSSFRINSKTNLHLVVNNGNVDRSGFFTDSLKVRHPIEVKNQFFRAGLGIEYRLSDKLSFQVISNFNRLTTSYYINHTLSDLSQFSTAGDEIFYAISPPYLLSNSFSPNSSSNIKTWIGLQVNIVYRIDFGRLKKNVF